MTLSKKLVCGTRSALNKGIETHKAKGWEVERIREVPRGKKSRFFTYVAHLKQEIQ